MIVRDVDPVSDCEENASPTKEDLVAVKEVDLAKSRSRVDEDAPDVQVLDAVPEGCVVRPLVDDAVDEVAVDGGPAQFVRSFEYLHQLLGTGEHVLIKVAEEAHVDPEEEEQVFSHQQRHDEEAEEQVPAKDAKDSSTNCNTTIAFFITTALYRVVHPSVNV